MKTQTPATTTERMAPFNSGLTLVETLVSISVILIVVTVSTQAIQSSFKDRRYAAKQSIATYLANDGIEQIRQLRDNNLIALTNETGTAVTDFWDGLPAASPSSTNRKLFSIDNGATRYCSPNGNRNPQNRPERCSVLINNGEGSYEPQTPNAGSATLPPNTYRLYHEVLPESTPTKKRLQTVVEFEHNGSVNDFTIVTELSNVNSPSANPIN